MELPLGAAADQEVDKWLAELPPSQGRPWIAIAPGSKMPAKIWPAERFAQVVTQLIEQFDVWPIVVGGPEDREVGENLLRAWGRGYLAAGNLGLSATAAAMARCRIYLGNDTGAMHLAVTAKLPCVAIFSSRTSPGRWYPYGDNHRVFRTAIDCEGCELTTCIERKMECIYRIGVDEVLQGCAELLRSSPHRD
jgi:ADP-heptose:LPS heptosyltransferase